MSDTYWRTSEGGQQNTKAFIERVCKEGAREGLPVKHPQQQAEPR